MRARFFAIAALVVGFLFAEPAGANPLKAVWTGTFNYIDGSLREGNQKIPFTATVFYDPSLGSNIVTTPFRETASGGTATGYVSPILSAIFTAPGLNLVMPGDQSGIIRVGDDFFELRSSYFGDLGAGFDGGHGYDLYFFSPSLTMNPSELFVSSPGESGGGTLETEPLYAKPQLQPNSLTITAVPEPASWAMLLAGFAGIGFMMRTRRKTAPAWLAILRQHFAGKIK